MRRPNFATGKPRRKYPTFTFYLMPGDQVLLAFIQECLGTDNRSEAVRTAIRAYAMHLEKVMK